MKEEFLLKYGTHGASLVILRLCNQLEAFGREVNAEPNKFGLITEGRKIAEELKILLKEER